MFHSLNQPMLSPTDALFTAALGLTPPWYCRQSDFSPDKSRLDLWLDFPAGSWFMCPKCLTGDIPVHDSVDKEWRHMDFFQHVCYLHARVPRIRCTECGVLQVHVPWARPGSGFTMLFEALVLSMAPDMPVAAIARHVREHDTRLWRILEHRVACARDREDFYGVTEVAIDETSRRCGHKYVSLVADVKKRRVLFVTKGKGQDVIGRFADDFHEHGGDPSAIKHVSMDMSPAFIAGVRECLPDADITFDRFHMMKLAGEAVDEVRKEEAIENPFRKGSIFLGIVQGLRTFFELTTALAEPYLNLWYQWTRNNRIDPVKEFAWTIKRHWNGILKFHETRMTAGFLEGMNSLIQAAKWKARGYRTTNNLITMIYLIAGKLDFQLTHLK